MTGDTIIHSTRRYIPSPCSTRSSRPRRPNDPSLKRAKRLSIASGLTCGSFWSLLQRDWSRRNNVHGSTSRQPRNAGLMVRRQAVVSLPSVTSLLAYDAGWSRDRVRSKPKLFEPFSWYIVLLEGETAGPASTLDYTRTVVDKQACMTASKAGKGGDHVLCKGCRSPCQEMSGSGRLPSLPARNNKPQSCGQLSPLFAQRLVHRTLRHQRSQLSG